MQETLEVTASRVFVYHIYLLFTTLLSALVEAVTPTPNRKPQQASSAHPCRPT